MNKKVWDQLRGITGKDLCKFLKKDGWDCSVNGGSQRFYTKGEKTVSIHYHGRTTYTPRLLKLLLSDIGWSEQDLKRLKVIK